MKPIEDQAKEYAEALNDIADILDLPTSSSTKDIVEAVHDMRAHLSAYELYKAENARLRGLLHGEGHQATPAGMSG